MQQKQHDQKTLIIQAVLNAFKEMPIEGKSWFHEINKHGSN